MPKEAERTVLTFRVTERGQWAYILWPWTTPEDFIYTAAKLGARYELRMPLLRPTQQQWIEFVATEGIRGEYIRDLYFGRLKWGSFMYRRFAARGSHYLTQHGLDGLPRTLWDAAYEYTPGLPVGNVQILFRVEPRGYGVFVVTFHEWIQHFVSGRNEHFRNMAITVKES